MDQVSFNFCLREGHYLMLSVALFKASAQALGFGRLGKRKEGNVSLSIRNNFQKIAKDGA